VRALLALGLVTVVAVAACGDSVDSNLALDEPLRVKYALSGANETAQFFTGDMPAPNGGPVIQSLQIGSDQMSPGTQNRGGYGVVLAPDAYTVAVRLQGRTSGYWIARVSELDVIDNGVIAHLLFDISTSMPTGQYQVELSGIDKNGLFGDRTDAPLAIIPRLDTSGPAVISLKWDAGVDLDLQLATPYGTFLSPKHQTTASAGTDAGTGAAPGYGYLDGDSVASCVDDGLRQEDVVFATPPIPGVYTIYVNAFSLCSLPGTNYQVSVLQNGNVTQSWYGNISAPEVQQGGFQLGQKIADVTF
jgi:hypothetical protein